MNSPNTTDKSNTGKPPRKGYMRRYTPPCEIRDIPGVRKTQDLHQDRYNGTKDDLVAMGLLPSELFPGEPDMPAGGVTLWPPDAKHGGGRFYPGRMQVTRTAAGTFTIRLAVSAEEQARRRQDEETRHARQERERLATEQIEDEARERTKHEESLKGIIDMVLEKISHAQAELALTDEELISQRRQKLRDEVAQWEGHKRTVVARLKAFGATDDRCTPRLRLVHSDRRVAP